MEYRGIWVVFLTVWFLLGSAVAVLPVHVARFLKPKGELPSSTFLRVWRVIGVIMAAGSLVKLIGILA